MTRVLIVEDDPQLLRALAINLRARHYDVDTAPDGATALAAANRRPPDLVILDLGLPDMDGIQVIRGLRGWYPATIMCSPPGRPRPTKFPPSTQARTTT